MLTLILGGARSGKSAFAEQQALEVGGDAVLFVATAEAGDQEMRRRIDRHRRSRPATWQTIEAPRRVGEILRRHGSGAQAVIVDCLTLLVANVLNGWKDPWAPEVAEAVRDEVGDLVTAARALKTHVFVVSNEVGMGLVPPSPLGRAYRDLLGEANRRLAAAADAVYLLVAGIPVRVK
ncbi:MAG: bifunctional adenosylcobinamide kinase/adenosylcobinamide-phosphate guanylyltransferase [Ardenticatenia bacterium]|nr:bifunctional adenosylcobinamide kinase/adenosylcobinamide-phosphate guanylyltransferase [Ardenticatenia bacterium]